MRDLPVRKVPGFGRVTERCLEGLGVEVSAHLHPVDASADLVDLRGYLRPTSRAVGHGSLVRVLRLMVSYLEVCTFTDQQQSASGHLR